MGSGFRQLNTFGPPSGASCCLRFAQLVRTLFRSYSNTPIAEVHTFGWAEFRMIPSSAGETIVCRPFGKMPGLLEHSLPGSLEDGGLKKEAVVCFSIAARTGPKPLSRQSFDAFFLKNGARLRLRPFPPSLAPLGCKPVSLSPATIHYVSSVSREFFGHSAIPDNIN